MILERLSDGYFYSTEPIAGQRNTFDFWDVLKVDSNSQYLHPQGYRCVAEYHSHPDIFDAFAANNPELSERQARALNSFFSDIDLSINILERGFFLLLTCPVRTVRCSNMSPRGRKRSGALACG